MPTVDLGLVVGSNGQGVPTGGSAGQILAKNSSSNYDTGWVPMSAAAAAAFGIVENGNAASHTISKGQYVIWKGVLYTADAAIASGTTLAASGGNKNLTAVSGGGLNALNADIVSLNSSISVLDESKLKFVAVGSVTSSASKIVTVTNNGKYLIAAIAGSNRTGLYAASASSSGGISITTLFEASALTVASSADNKITFSSSASTSTSVYILCFNGTAAV